MAPTQTDETHNEYVPSQISLPYSSCMHLTHTLLKLV